MPQVGWRRATFGQVISIFGVVIFGVEAIVFAYYRDFGWDRLRFELAMSAFIAAAVGLPVIFFLVRQHERLRSLTQDLVLLSERDQMTGLLNRQTFLARLDELLVDGSPGDCAGVFAYVDADHFKLINDGFGHARGDQVIQLIARHVRAATRPGDLGARLGGEEFGIFWTRVSLEAAGQMADRMRREIEGAGQTLGIPGLTISVSIGLAMHRDGMDALTTMQEADRSLYAAKHGGRNAVVVELKRYRAA